MGLALKCVNKSTYIYLYLPKNKSIYLYTVDLPKNKYSDFHVFGGSVSVRIERRRAATKLLTDNIQWKLRQNIPKIHGGNLVQCALKPPPHLRVVQIIHLLLMNYLVLELHKQEPWYSNKIVGFKPLPLIGVNAWSKYNCRSPSENQPRRTLLRIE